MTLIGIVLSQKNLIEKHKSGICLLSFVLFWALGSELFLKIEGPEFEKTQQDVLDVKNRILKKYENANAEVLEAFIDEMREMGIRGLPTKNGTITEWRFSDSAFFVVTLLTTVGYGHFAPKTLLGKTVCLIFTAVGIPITLIHLSFYVDKLLKLSENYKAYLFRRHRNKLGPFSIRLLHASSLMTIIVMVCFILPAFVFIQYEKGWSLFDGIYFCFISLTTVGLGDLVPALNPDLINTDLYKFCTSVFLIIGVTIIMFMMAMCGDFCRNYKNGYEILPFTISAEKVPINPGKVLTYGSIITQNGISEANAKLIE